MFSQSQTLKMKKWRKKINTWLKENRKMLAFVPLRNLALLALQLFCHLVLDLLPFYCLVQILSLILLLLLAPISYFKTSTFLSSSLVLALSSYPIFILLSLVQTPAAEFFTDFFLLFIFVSCFEIFLLSLSFLMSTLSSHLLHTLTVLPRAVLLLFFESNLFSYYVASSTLKSFKQTLSDRLLNNY